MNRLAEETDVSILQQATRLLELENNRLSQAILQLTRENAQLKGQTPESLQLRLQRLEEQLSKARQREFGRSSEKRSAPDSEEKPKEPQKGHGPRVQPELARIEVVHELDEADKTCRACGGALEEMKGQFEESEDVHVLERRFILRSHKRKKYRCRCGGCVETAEGPPKLNVGGRYSVEFAIEVATAKYIDHLPLERQVRIMGREGLTVDSQTLWNQVERLAAVLTPLYERIGQYVRSKPVIGADETRWMLLGEKGKKAKSSVWQVWAACAEDAVYYEIHDSRGIDAANKLLGEYTGVVMCDGYSVYSALAKQRGGFVLTHCWAHVRRKFIEMESSFPTECAAILALIRELYTLEQDCPSEDERRKRRHEQSRAILSKIQRWTMDVCALPESGLYNAIRYMTERWAGLTAFVEDPRIPLDNNGTERALRGVVIGRKNHYGSRSRRGTEVAAVLYTLVETAKLAGIEPKQYLRDCVLAELVGQSAELPSEYAR